MKNQKIQKLVEGAVLIALATVLGFIKIFQLPWGGSITLLSMLPICIFSIKWGVKDGLIVSAVYSLIQFGDGITTGLFGWGLTPIMLISCILLDYIAAYTVLGIAGIFRKHGTSGLIGGVTLAVVLRFGLHVLSGIVVWQSAGELWNGLVIDNTVLYSLAYNGCYMLPELIFTLIGTITLSSVPIFRRLLLNHGDKI